MSDPSEPLLRIGYTDFFVRGGPIEGDITRCGADVLVSSAGTDATMSSGVSKAIFDAGGPEILAALKAHQPLVSGDVVITSAGKLTAKNIYHTVVVGSGDERRVLQASMWRVVSHCIAEAQSTGMTSFENNSSDRVRVCRQSVPVVRSGAEGLFAEVDQATIPVQSWRARDGCAALPGIGPVQSRDRRSLLNAPALSLSVNG